MNIKSLGLVEEERIVREFINTPTGVIEVYEPSIGVLEELIEIQRQLGYGLDNDTKTVVFDGADVLKALFPLLTNVDFGDISDEELQKIIDNPSVHLLIAQQYVAQIVAEANKLYAQRLRTELMNSESVIAQMELVNQIPSLIMDKAKRDGSVNEMVEKVTEISDELENAIEKEKEKLSEMKKNTTDIDENDEVVEVDVDDKEDDEDKEVKKDE